MSEKIKLPSRLFRAGEIDARALDPSQEDDRRVQLSFSSEETVLRFFGFEILGHDKGEVDLARLASGRAALLVDHVQTVDSQVGVVEKAWIENGRGYAIVRFGKSARADEILARVRDGEITGVSVGYEITRLVQVGESDGEPIFRANWRPYEITLCPVPADPTVGIGRTAEGSSEIEITVERKEKRPKKGLKMSKKKDDAATTETRTAPTQPAQVDTADLMRKERARVKEIRALGRKFKMDDKSVDAAIEGETTVDQFQRAILDHMGSKEQEATRAKDAEIGMSKKEVGEFSLMRALRYLSNPTDKRAIEAAKFEIEASRAAEEKLGRSAKGLLVPADVLASQNFVRSQAAGDATKGAALVATDHMDGSFIGLLRKRAALTRLGVRTLSGLQGNVDIPRQTGGGTAYWVGEGFGPTESDLTFDNISLTPHTLAGAVAITRRAMQQASPDMEALVRDDLIKVLALEMDRVGINGDVDPDAPDGLLDASINDVDFAAAGQPTWAEVVQLESEIGADDADVEGMKYLFNATMRGWLKSTPKVSGTAEFMMKGNEVNGYQSVVSNNSPAGGMILGNWSDFIIGMWSGLDLTVDTATLASSGGVYVRAFQDVDFGVRHDESFAYGRDYV